MSCVIGLVTEDGVLLGSDSGASDGNIIVSSNQSKLFVREVLGTHGQKIRIGIGAVGSIKAGMVLAHKFSPPDILDAKPDEYVMAELVPVIEKLFRENGVIDEKCAQHSDGTMLLVAVLNNLYYVGEDFGVISNSNGYDAIGSARELALGAICALLQVDTPPKMTVEVALNAAAMLTAFVEYPFEIRKI